MGFLKTALEEKIGMPSFIRTRFIVFADVSLNLQHIQRFNSKTVHLELLLISKFKFDAYHNTVVLVV